MAWSLREMGYSDVTILEKSNRIGGRSVTYKARGFDQVLTTGWWDDEYDHTLVPLFERFGMLDSAEPVDFKGVITWLNNTSSVSFHSLYSHLHSILCCFVGAISY